jgi:hypothetical protein
LIELGRKELACLALKSAKAKQYPGVDAQIMQYCK